MQRGIQFYGIAVFFVSITKSLVLTEVIGLLVASSTTEKQTSTTLPIQALAVTYMIDAIWRHCLITTGM